METNSELGSAKPVTFSIRPVFTTRRHIFTMIDDFFIHFSAKKKVDYINKVGIHLASRIHNRFVIELYQLSDSFVEIWYNPVRCSIYKVKTHKSDQCFEPYLENISLDF